MRLENRSLVIMAIFKRKNKDKAVDGNGGAPTEQEKVKWSKRPASQSNPLPVSLVFDTDIQTLRSSSNVSRHGSPS